MQLSYTQSHLFLVIGSMLFHVNLSATKTLTPSFDTFFDFVSEAQNESISALGSLLAPPTEIQKWVALGDSYAAGPGAGKDVDDGMPDCMRGEQAYPYLLQQDKNFPGPGGWTGPRPEFIMKACTGDKTHNMVDRDNPNYQLAPISQYTNAVTLSIGGNDVGFAKILRACVFLELGGPKCDEAIATARAKMYGIEFANKYFKVLQELLDRMEWKRRTGPNMATAIYQTGYSQFFDAYTEQCDNVGFLYWGAGIRMKQELRYKLNRLTHELNYVLQYYIDLFNTRNTKEGNYWRLETTPVHFVNVDPFYSGHRFCRDGIEEPDFENKDSYFYHLLSPRQAEVKEGKGKNLTKDEAEDMVEKYYDQEMTTATMPVEVIKAFHPTPPGFRSTSLHVAAKFQYQAAARSFANGGSHFDLMVVGDHVAYASQDPNSDIYQGFIPHLKAIFRAPRFYGTPGTPTMNPITPEFIGSRQPDNYNGEPHDCWQTATLERLGDKLERSPALATKNKVVVLMAGTVDVLYDLNLESAEERVKRLLTIIFDQDKEALVLLVQVPMVGAAEEATGKEWYPLQRRIIDFNAMLAELANEYLTRSWGRVWLVHSSATPLEHHDGGFILPSADGYRRIAHDLAEALVYARGYRLFKTRENAWGATTKRSLPLPSGSIIKRGVQGGILHCHERDAYTKKQPVKEEIRTSFLQGLQLDDFIEKVACNRTEMCKISQDGVHGDPLQPSMLSLNATICQRNGGKPGKPDQLNTHIRMPTPDYNLAESQCAGIVKDIIEYCVMEKNAIGGSWRPEDEEDPPHDRDLQIIMQGSRLDGVVSEMRNYEAEFFDQNDLKNLLTEDVALPARSR